MLRFRMLLALALVLKLLGWVELIIGVVSAFGALWAPNFLAKAGLAVAPGSNWLAFFLILFFSLLLAMALIAQGELIQLFLALEKNTRRLAEFWDKH